MSNHPMYEVPFLDHVPLCRVCGTAREATQIGTQLQGEQYSSRIRIECACGKFYEGASVARVTGASRRDRAVAMCRQFVRTCWSRGIDEPPVRQRRASDSSPTN